MDTRALDAPRRNACRHHFAADAARELFRRPLNLFCLTLYNEPLERVSVSLAALWRSVCHARQESKSVLVILIDGLEKADPAILDAFSRAKRIGSTSGQDVDAECFYSCASSRELLRAMGAEEAGIVDGEIRLIVCIKPANLGKLHSHAIFFGSLCPQLEPVYCHQIDAGTILQADTVQRLVEHVERSPEIGAVAPRIVTPPPRRGGLLAIWQYWDFILSRAFSWPSEIATGYLSVLPGQYCVVRWRAMRTMLSGPIAEDEPVSAYLRGLAVTEPLDRIMYLAEDRVLGNEITMTHRGAWRFEYDIHAIAVTDPCEGLGELLQQRRRWTNSALAARLRLLGRSAGLALTGACRPLELFQIALRSLWQINLGILEHAGPALSICMLLAVVRGSGSIPMPWAATCAGLITSALLLMLVPLHRLGARVRSFLAGSRDFAATLGFAVPMVSTLLDNRNSMGNVLLLLLLLMASTLMPFLGTRNLQNLRTFATFMLVSPIVTSGILLYSIYNMHDASWGTKGLRTTRLTVVLQQKLQRLRKRAIAASLALNAAVVGFGTQIHLPVAFRSIVGDANLGTSIMMLESAVIVAIAAAFYHLRTRNPRTTRSLDGESILIDARQNR